MMPASLSSPSASASARHRSAKSPSRAVAARRALATLMMMLIILAGSVAKADNCVISVINLNTYSQSLWTFNGADGACWVQYNSYTAPPSQSAGEPSVQIGCNDPNETSCKVSLWGVSASCPPIDAPCGSYLVLSDGGNYCYGYSPDCNRRRRGLRASGGIVGSSSSSSSSSSHREAESSIA